MEPTTETLEASSPEATVEQPEELTEEQNLKFMEGLARLGQAGAELYNANGLVWLENIKDHDKSLVDGLAVQLKDGKWASPNIRVLNDRVNIVRYELPSIRLSKTEFESLVATCGSTNVYARSNEQQKLRADFAHEPNFPVDIPKQTTFAKTAEDKLGGRDRLLEKLKGFEGAWQACFVLDGTRLMIEMYRRKFDTAGMSYEQSPDGQKYTKTVIVDLENR